MILEAALMMSLACTPADRPVLEFSYGQRFTPTYQVQGFRLYCDGELVVDRRCRFWWRLCKRRLRLSKFYPERQWPRRCELRAYDPLGRVSLPSNTVQVCP